MFPDYMNDMLRQARCGHCDAPQTLADIWVVGVRRPEEVEAFYAEPVFIITTICKACGYWTNHTMRRSRAEAVEGVISFVKLIERECEGKEPILKIPGLGKKPAPPAPESAGQAQSSRPRPSRRSDQPTEPATDAEIKAFLLRLNKTSFRTGSKGFQSWLKHLGIDPKGDQK